MIRRLIFPTEDLNLKPTLQHTPAASDAMHLKHGYVRDHYNTVVHRIGNSVSCTVQDCTSTYFNRMYIQQVP